MEFCQDDSFEETLSTWFCIVISTLDSIMESNGLEDPAQRRAVTSQFMSSLGTWLEQGWFEVEGKLRYPLLCFLDGPLPGQAESRSARRALIPSDPPFSFSEVALGNCFHVFEEDPEVSTRIKQGVIGEERES